MSLINNESVVGTQLGVSLCFCQQDTVGHQLD